MLLKTIGSGSQRRVKNLIGGEFVESQSEASIDVINPVKIETLLGESVNTLLVFVVYI